MTDKRCDLAIVGLGPRGHYALECFLTAFSEHDHLPDPSIILFEETCQIGNGPVWDTSQPGSNWSNIHERALTLPARPKIRLGETVIGAFPAYQDWAGVNPDTSSSLQSDIYPPRKKVGTYLNERFNSLMQSTYITLVQDSVVDLTMSGTSVCLMTLSGRSYLAGQALLTVGHQPTVDDDQIEDWHSAALQNPALNLFPTPYPIGPITNKLNELNTVNMAVRGYGLATIDVARAAAEEFGSFQMQDASVQKQAYDLKPDVALKIVPFSLDGLPLAPKPLNARVDMQFEPSDTTLQELGTKLSDSTLQSAAQDETFLLNEMVPIIAKIYRSLVRRRASVSLENRELENLIRCWIDDPLTDHSCIVDTELSPVEILQELVDMATGEAPISLDYCIGQVWRHCHPTLYAALSHSQLSNEVLAKCIFTDEALKRYSFGPPVESIQQLIALHQAGVLDLDYLHNPDVETSSRGWVLSSGPHRTITTVMVDAVLDAPKIKAVNSPLLESLLNKGALQSVHDDLGIATSIDGFVGTPAGDPLPIAILGRLAKGTIIGVDAILECFGSRSRAWAVSAVEGHGRH